MQASTATAVKSKTVWASIFAVLGFLAQPQVLGILPEKPAAIIAGVAAVATIFFGRKAQADTHAVATEAAADAKAAANNSAAVARAVTPAAGNPKVF